MATTELLVTLDPIDAIVRMLNDENNTNFPTGTFEVSPPVSLGGTLTRVTLSARKSAHVDLDEPPFSGSIDFEYHRLDLAQYFQTALEGFRPTLPSSTRILLDELTRLSGVKFHLEDVVLELVGRENAYPYRLKAKSESLRWVGELSVDLVDDLTDLTLFLDASLPAGGPPRLGTLEAGPQLRSINANQPFINVTSVREELLALPLNVPFEESTQWVNAFRNAVALTDGGIWEVAAAPRPYNLYNARAVESARLAGGTHPSNPRLDRAVVVQLDPAYCTGLDDHLVLLPYCSQDYTESEYVEEPRLSNFGVKSVTDASDHRIYLNALSVGHVFTSVPTTPAFEIEEGIVWNADLTPNRTNLRDAVVLYNGQQRAGDRVPANPTLNRIVVVALSDHNTAYRGNYSIHYRAPIVLQASIPFAELDMPYSTTLTPTDHVGTCRYVLVEGEFAPGHALNLVTGEIYGTATALGSYTVVIDVIDDRNIPVRYRYTYQVRVAPLVVIGFAPDGVVGEAYDFTYSISGGVKPYSCRFTDGAPPTGIYLDDKLARLHGTLMATGPFNWNIEVLDSRNVGFVRSDSIVVGAV